MAETHDVTQLLHKARGGDEEALKEMLPLVYDALRQIAHHRLRGSQPETLSTTALVHEAYLRLIDQTQIEWQDRAHFYAVASQAMRFVILDYVRKRSAEKRGGRGRDERIHEFQIAADDRSEDVLALDEALGRLEEYDERLGRLVELKFFGGLNYEEMADVTGRSTATLKRDWRRARTWLYRLMKEDA